MHDEEVYYPFGKLNPEQEKVVRQYVEGKRVHDYGCGDLTLSRRLLELGAEKVYGIDRDLQSVPPTLRDKLFFHQGRFDTYSGTSEVAFLSWPANWETGVERLLKDTPTIIYLGKNTDGSSCGGSMLWDLLAYREVLTQVPDYRNTLIVYGPAMLARDPLPEEAAALNTDEVTSFEEAHGLPGPITKAQYAHCVSTLAYDKLPSPYRESLRRYVENGIMPGDSLKLTLENNLRALMLFRDRPGELLKIVLWLHNEVPSPAWGSPEKVLAWSQMAGGYSR